MENLWLEIIGAVITALLALIAYIGNKGLAKLDDIDDKVIKLILAVYGPEGNGEDKIQSLRDSVHSINQTLFDPNGTNGVIRKLVRLDRAKRHSRRIDLKLISVMNDIIAKANLDLEPVQYKDDD